MKERALITDPQEMMLAWYTSIFHYFNELNPREMAKACEQADKEVPEVLALDKGL